MSYNIGVVGATGQVGREFLRILDEGDRPDLPIGLLRLFASERSAGKRISVRSQEHVVEQAEPDPGLFHGLDFVLSAIGDDQARLYSPAIARAGALNVDKSNAWRMDPTVPLVVPEVNPQDARAHRGIIAGPNCSTTQMVVALWPIHQVNPIQRIIVDTYQAVSGTGWRAVDELQAQEEAHVGGGIAAARRVPAPDPFERDPRDRQLQGRRRVRRRAEDDRRDAQDLPRSRPADQRDLRTRARSRRPLRGGAHRTRAADAPGRSTRKSCAPRPASSSSTTRADRTIPCRSVWRAPIQSSSDASARIRLTRGLVLWIVGDNLRKGAALNAIQVFELVARNGWRSPAIRQEVHA